MRWASACSVASVNTPRALVSTKAARMLDLIFLLPWKMTVVDDLVLDDNHHQRAAALRDINVGEQAGQQKAT